MFRGLLSLVALLCALGAIVAMVFVNISGTSTNSIIRRFYFSELEGNYRWTMYGVCQTVDNQYQCTAPAPAYPYSPADNFSFTNIPNEFIANRNTYYYLSRVAYGFFLVALLFSVLAALSILLPGCNMDPRSGSPATTVSFMAFLFATTASTLNTAAHALGVHEFVKAGFTAVLGRDMFITMWIGTGLLLVAFVCLGLRNRIEQRPRVIPSRVGYA